ncbi:hypothetical protein PR202_gb00866 [Eleusine coracana subsp. coracana]|uniref:Protein NRT1/ PTR FAMILY 5.1 n=1 Tax=Eleusine coracana subsp. coracana TaxID=191504 RepID=A0AAV5DV43_ELECO|nr:hypothetical protein PR202_gb00866 [Eleusine coracana subsp. coracana]
MTPMDEEAKQEVFTKDGSVDLRGRPASASRTGRWKACAFLVGYEAFERMAFYGVASNLVVYLTTQLREETVASVRNVNNWTGAVWMTPIAGAYIADAYLGRFWTFTISSLIYLTVSMQPSPFLPFFPSIPCPSFFLMHSAHTEDDTTMHNAKCLVKRLLVGIVSDHLRYCRTETIVPYHLCTLSAPGTACAPPRRVTRWASSTRRCTRWRSARAGTKPNISTFGAEQFDDLEPREREAKAPFFSSFAGGLVAVLVLVYVQENVGWGVGYAVPTAGLLLFYAGAPLYRHKPVGRGAAASGPVRLVGRVVLAAFANPLPSVVSGELLHERDASWYKAAGKRRLHHTPAYYRFLDKAAVKKSSSLEEVKLIAGMIVVWLTTLVPCTIWAQVNTLFVKQGSTLDRSVGSLINIPAASLGSTITISMLLSIPVYDRVFVPLMRTGNQNPRGITLLQRMGIGCALQVAAVACAYLVEVRRMRVVRERSVHGKGETVPMTVFWMLPQYVLLGVGDVFNSVGILEFFYDQSPHGMRSMGTTFFTSGLGAGNFLNSLLVTLVDRVTRNKSWIGDNLNDSHLDYYYVFLLLLSVLNMAIFVWVARRYRYKREFLELEPGTSEMEMPHAGNGKVIDCAKGAQTAAP